jgi:hypothetical protein
VYQVSPNILWNIFGYFIMLTLQVISSNLIAFWLPFFYLCSLSDSSSFLILFWFMLLDSLLVHGHTSLVFRRLNSSFWHLLCLYSDPSIGSLQASFSIISNCLHLFWPTIPVNYTVSDMESTHGWPYRLYHMQILF